MHMIVRACPAAMGRSRHGLLPRYRRRGVPMLGMSVVGQRAWRWAAGWEEPTAGVAANAATGQLRLHLNGNPLYHILANEMVPFLLLHNQITTFVSFYYLLQKINDYAPANYFLQFLMHSLNTTLFLVYIETNNLALLCILVWFSNVVMSDHHSVPIFNLLIVLAVEK
jgi:hypothetical protein